MLELYISACITFFVAIDPPGCAAIYASLTSDASAKDRRIMAIRAVVISSIILIFFGYFGQALLGSMGVSLDAFRIAGGIMLFVIALEMVFEKRTQRREDRAQEVIETPEIEDVSVFPMAMPMIAGPGSIAAIMLYMARAEGFTDQMAVLAAMGSILLLMLVSLLAAGPLIRLMGQRVETVITRVLGVILAALAAQFIVDGVKGSFGL